MIKMNIKKQWIEAIENQPSEVIADLILQSADEIKHLREIITKALYFIESEDLSYFPNEEKLIDILKGDNKKTTIEIVDDKGNKKEVDFGIVELKDGEYFKKINGKWYIHKNNKELTESYHKYKNEVYSLTNIIIELEKFIDSYELGKYDYKIPVFDLKEKITQLKENI